MADKNIEAPAETPKVEKTPVITEAGYSQADGSFN